MLQDLLNEHAKELGLWRLIGDYSRAYKVVVICFFIESGLLLIDGIVSIRYHSPSRSVVAAMLALMLPMTVLISNKVAQITVAKYYGIEGENINWHEQIFKYRKDFIKNYLKSEGLYNAEKISAIVHSLEERAEGEKFKGWFGAGLILVFTVPIWSQLVQVVVQLEHSTTPKLIILLGFLALVFMIIGLISMFRSMMLDVYERKYRRTVRLINLMKELHLESILGRAKKRTSSIPLYVTRRVKNPEM